MRRALHKIDRLLARMVFFRGHPRNIPLRFHVDGNVCFQKDCEKRHW